MEAFYGFAREIDLRDAGLEHRRLRAVARARRRRAARCRHLERHRALQPGRRRQQPAAPRLARRRCGTSSPRRPAESVPRPAPRDAAVADRADARPQARVAGPRRSAWPARRHPDRPGRPHPDATGDVAARPAARLAPSRGQVGVVGIPPADGPDTRAARGRGRRRSVCSNRSGRSTTTRQGQTGLALPVPRPGATTSGGGTLYDPAEEAGDSRTTSRATGRSAT